jgi:hypothetical protein
MVLPDLLQTGWMLNVNISDTGVYPEQLPNVYVVGTACGLIAIFFLLFNV